MIRTLLKMGGNESLRLEQLERHTQFWRDCFLKYGRHATSCALNWRHSVEKRCTCGFERLCDEATGRIGEA